MIEFWKSLPHIPMIDQKWLFELVGFFCRRNLYRLKNAVETRLLIDVDLEKQSLFGVADVIIIPDSNQINTLHFNARLLGASSFYFI